jgi:hypothetical protein
LFGRSGTLARTGPEPSMTHVARPVMPHPAASYHDPAPSGAKQRRNVLTRRSLWYALALLWLLDGALQLQHFMFTRGFAHQIIAPAAAGQPSFVAELVRWNARLIAGHPVPLNAVFATIQLALGAGFLFRRTVPIAIVASVAWAVGVWVFGEGLGGLFGGQVTGLVGAPGGAVLYAVIALAAWPTGGYATTAEAGAGPAHWVIRAWSALWLGFAALNILPDNLAPSATVDQLRANAVGVPAWLAELDRGTASVVHALGPAGVALVVTLEFAIGLFSLGRGRSRLVALWGGLALSAVFWMIGQSFGLLFSGQATDPNSGPLLIVLGLAAVGATRREPAILEHPVAAPVGIRIGHHLVG